MAHRKLGEQACESCLFARAAYSRSVYRPTGNPPGRQPVTIEHKRERLRKAAAAWRTANPERAREMGRRYEARRDPEKRRANARNTQKRLRARFEEIKRKPCMDCGVQYPPYVMHFDHRNPAEKLFNIGRGAVGGATWIAVLAEVAKCDLVCANCHAERTWGPKAP